VERSAPKNNLSPTTPPTHRPKNLPADGAIPVILLPAAILVLVPGKATMCWPTSSPEQGHAVCSAYRARPAAPRAPPAAPGAAAHRPRASPTARRGHRPAPRHRPTPPVCGLGEICLPRLRAGRDLRHVAAAHRAQAPPAGRARRRGRGGRQGNLGPQPPHSGERMRRENMHLCIALHWPGKMAAVFGCSGGDSFWYAKTLC
jgi:hypothetical protein